MSVAIKREEAVTVPASPPYSPGKVLAGKYRIEQILGEGGMGVVVAATHLQLDQRVAIKFLLPGALKNAQAVERFTREARVAAKIRSEHVVRVHDVGNLDDGTPYMVMEYLEGCDLGELLDKHGPLPIPDTVEYILQTCEALAEVHAAGIIHRDLKPPNLYLTQRADGSPVIKLLDFGISKFTVHPDDPKLEAALTATTAILGSPGYMSPEQLKSTRNVDARADIWAIGTILYELLTGTPAFFGETIPQLCAMIASEVRRCRRRFGRTSPSRSRRRSCAASRRSRPAASRTSWSSRACSRTMRRSARSCRSSGSRPRSPGRGSPSPPCRPTRWPWRCRRSPRATRRRAGCCPRARSGRPRHPLARCPCSRCRTSRASGPPGDRGGEGGSCSSSGSSSAAPRSRRTLGSST